MKRVDRILWHEKALWLKRILQPDNYNQRISLYWAINTRTVVDTIVERYYRQPI